MWCCSMFHTVTCRYGHRFLPALLLAKQYGLRVTIHLGEVEDSHHETEQMLAFAPQRLGHAVLMVRSDQISSALHYPV